MKRHPVRIPTDYSQPVDRPEWVVLLVEHDAWVTATCGSGHTRPWTRGGTFPAACPDCLAAMVPR